MKGRTRTGTWALVGGGLLIATHLVSEGWPDEGAQVRIPQPGQFEVARPQHTALETASLQKRPLFVPRRRLEVTATPLTTPVAQTPTAPAQPPYLDPTLKLVGVVTNGTSLRAVVSMGYESAQHVTVGMTLSGWTVSTIEDSALTLTFGENTRRLTIYDGIN